MTLAETRKAHEQVLLAVEEPEAFLHPSAQRTLARRLLQPRNNTRMIVTTHSSCVVDEADAADVVLVKRQRFYTPQIPAEREAIHSYLMRGQGAEAMFASGVLLVEGESDYQFFEALRRRAAVHDPEGHLDCLRVVWTGGSSRFAPWIQLFDAYGQSSDRPILWLAAYDADAGKEARVGLREAGVTVPQDVSQAIADMNAAATETTSVTVDLADAATLNERARRVDAWRRRARAANEACSNHGLPLRFLPVDLEDASLEGASESTCEQVCHQLALPAASRISLLHHLESKSQPKTGKTDKAPWKRGLIGSVIPPHELGADVREILTTWFSFSMPKEKARTFVRDWCKVSASVTDASSLEAAA